MSVTAAGDFATGVPNTRMAALRAAQRHTRIVRALRVLLPVSGTLILASIVAAIVFDPRVMLEQVDAESMGISGGRIVMQAPKFSGYQPDSSGKAKNYEVTAARAEQNLSKPDEVDLFGISGRMDIREDGWVKLTAPIGHFDKAAQTLDLNKSIELVTDLGDRADLTNTRLDFTKSIIVTNDPVAIKMERADLNAASMTIYEAGSRAVFSGNVVMTLKPDKAAPVEPHGFGGLR